MYLLSKFMDKITKVKDLEEFYRRDPNWRHFYSLHETYALAKQECIDRAKKRITALKKEIKKIERKLPKLEAMCEMPNSDTAVQECDARDSDSSNSDGYIK